MPLPRGYISHSQIRTYGECPRKYYFAYVEEVRAPINEKIFLGEVFHSAIEQYFLHQISGAPLTDDDAVGVFTAAFDQGGAGREIDWQTPRRDTRDRGLAFLKYFLRHIAPSVRPLMVEKELCVELPGSGVLLKGVIDLVEEDYCITDFKTATGKWPESRALNSPQMVIYKYLFDRSFGTMQSGLKYEVLYAKSARNVRHQTLRVVPADDAVESLLTLIGHVAEMIGAGAFQASEGPFCRFCEYRELCRQKGPRG